MKAECYSCGYVWETESQMVYVNCPSCRKAVKLKEVDNGEQRK